MVNFMSLTGESGLSLIKVSAAENIPLATTSSGYPSCPIPRAGNAMLVALSFEASSRHAVTIFRSAYHRKKKTFLHCLLHRGSTPGPGPFRHLLPVIAYILFFYMLHCTIEICQKKISCTPDRVLCILTRFNKAYLLSLYNPRAR